MNATAAASTTQYLTFKLDNEAFALDISRVREVLDFPAITKVPRTPEFMRGAINLRGSVVPVIDMKLKFGMSRTERSVNTCVIIIDVRVDDETIVLGILADSVQEVLDLASDDVQPSPRIGSRLKTEFIKGMGRQNDGFIIILDIDKAFSSRELTTVQGLGETQVHPG